MNLRYLLLLALVVAAILIGKYCCMPKNALVEIKSAVKAPMGISFIEVKDGVRKHVAGKIKVTFIDTAGKVLSANGFPLKTIEVTEILSIGLAPSASFSPQKPYAFFIKAEADGYETNIIPVTVSQDVPNFIPVYMAKLGDLPSGGGLAASVGSALGYELGNRTITAGTGAQQFKITFQQGTNFGIGEKILNEKTKLGYSLLRGVYNPSDSNRQLVNRAFPGGFEVIQAYDRTGSNVPIATPAAPIYFTTAGWFTMEIKTPEGLKVDRFSKAADVEMPINASTVNPATNQPVKVGDRIPLWSMNEQTGVWYREGETVVSAGTGGQLMAKFQVSHLSAWNLDFFNNGCLTPSQDITVTYINNEFPNNCYGEYLDESTGAVLKSTVINLSTGSPLTIIRASTQPARLYVHDGMDVNRLLRGRTGVLNCSGTGTLGLLGSAAYPCIELEFRVAIDANNDNNPECELALPNIGVVSNDNSSCSGFKYFAGATNSNGIVKVASDGSRIECVKLSFTNAAMEAIYMTFLVNYPNNSGTTQGDCTVNNGSTQQFEYGYVTTNVGPCSKRFTITIKNKTTGGNTITGLACPED